MRVDRAHLEEVRARFAVQGIEADTVLLNGEPADGIVKLADARGVHLIAMSNPPPLPR